MSVIEKAAKRLEELNKAGVASSLDRSREIPESTEFPHRAVWAEEQSLTSGMVPSLQSKARSPKQVVHPAPSASSGRVSIDLSRLAELGFVTQENPRSQVAEEFRIIKRPLIRNATGKSAVPIKNGNLIMVTSALPGEGKSRSVVNLAISIAMEPDSTVLIVDADVAKPSIPQLLDLRPERGLLDLLVDDSLELSQVLLWTNVERLRLLPSGTPHPRATELLASEAMNRLLSEMAERYSNRIIIFDSPPLLMTTEARALAAHMGQIVFVVEAERTTHAAVKQALATIESFPIKLLLLNKSRIGANTSYYGYRGSKGYGHYGYGL